VNGKTLIDIVMRITKKWAKQQKKEERSAKAQVRRLEALVERPARVTVKQAAYETIEAAYLKMSNNGKNPAHARQIMYAARPEILRRTGDEQLDDNYFTQQLLPEFQADFPDLTKNWDVVYDARGHFVEPHTELVVPLGTIDVRKYLATVKAGPPLLFGAVLFIEKEGFLPLFKQRKLAERFDLAIMSTKGMSVTASRRLVDQVCHAFDVPLLVLRDFDKAGFSIVYGFTHDTKRYRWTNRIRVIDLGLRLVDVRKWNLEAEDVVYPKGDPRPNLARNGATPEEVEFLCGTFRGLASPGHFKGQRVELNMFTSDDLIAWIESELQANGVKKVIPSDDILADRYRLRFRDTLIESRLEEAAARIRAEVSAEVRQMRLPKKLRAKVAKELKHIPMAAWDGVVGSMAREAATLAEKRRTLD
jgi:hypothetical protein